MSAVWKARDTRTGREVAVKVLAEGRLSDEELRLRFKREAEVLARLESPHLVPLLGEGTAQGLPYLVLPFFPEGSVAGRLDREGALPAPLARELTRQLLDALETVHGANMVHRDVHPGNLLLADARTVVLGDFGLARERASVATRTGHVLGTYATMAPEQLYDAREVDARSDIYGAGATLLWMLTGKAPFSLGDGDRLDSQLELVPVELRGVIRRATQQDPARRYDTAAAMRAALLDGEPDEPGVPPSPPWVTVAAAGVGVGLIVGALLLLGWPAP